MNQKSLLGIIAIVLIAILGFLVIQSQERTPAEKIADGFEDVTTEIADEIDDATN